MPTGKAQPEMPTIRKKEDQPFKTSTPTTEKDRRLGRNFDATDIGRIDFSSMPSDRAGLKSPGVVTTKTLPETPMVKPLLMKGNPVQTW